MPEVFYIVGQTSVGKTAVAVGAALQCDGEIVGADAFQVYEGMDILTAKPSVAQRAAVRHHLVGTIPIDREFDVAQYVTAARAALTEIQSRKRVPLVVGGTGLYIRALTHGLAELPPADAALREQLEARDLPRLQAQLETLDPVSTASMDLKNKRRLIRAIEVCLLTSRPFSSFKQQQDQTSPARGVLLTRDRADLCERIEERARAMFKEGVVDEALALGAAGRTAEQVIGLKEIQAFAAGAISEANCIERIQKATKALAKRQLTWFRGQASFAEINLSAAPSESAAVSMVLARIHGTP